MRCWTLQICIHHWDNSSVFNTNTVLHLITNQGLKFQVAFKEDILPTIIPSHNTILNTTFSPNILAGIVQKMCLPISSD